MKYIQDAINGGRGYVSVALTEGERQMVRDEITDCYLSRLASLFPASVRSFASRPITEYHKAVEETGIPHSAAFPKWCRVLPPASEKLLWETQFFATMRRESLGGTIADDENFGWRNVTWRLVRPREKDYGALHADQWFWDVDGRKIPPGFRPVKVWIQICGSEKCGLMVVPGSHKTTHRYRVEERDGRAKPIYNGPDVEHLGVIPPCNPGQGIVFNHNLLHRGIENTSDQTRISIDFTLLVPDDN